MHPSADLLTSIGICVTAAAVLAIIVSKVRQPLILAYLLAGVIIGPQMGLGLITDSTSIHHMAEIGLILLLFLIGMELELQKLVEAGKAVVSAGVLQFLLCVFLGLGFFWLLGFRMAPGNYGLLYGPVCLAMSSTMIVVKLLYEKQELDTLPGRVTLGILVFQDLWAMVVLAVQPSLLNPHWTPLLGSIGKSILLVVATLAASRWVLPPLFRSVAKQPELILVLSLAWCFTVCGGSQYGGLSREMGALIAGASLSSFPYTLDVTAKIVSIRDFFVTLFFVALGMQIPPPTWDVLGLALITSLFLIASRFVTIFPLLRACQLGNRASLLPPINLAQMSEFSLVIAALGVGYGQIPSRFESILTFVFAVTSVASTYLIGHNDALARWINNRFRRVGLKDLDSTLDASASAQSFRNKDILLLGFYHQASALVHEWERPDALSSGQQLLARILVIDFNPHVHAELKRRGIACIYGDLAHMETLQHAPIDQAALILLTIPDSILRGTSNRRLLQQLRRLCPGAHVIATADRARQAIELYEAGADYVFVPQLQSAQDRARIVEEGLRSGFEATRAAHLAQLRQRDEVLA